MRRFAPASLAWCADPAATPVAARGAAVPSGVALLVATMLFGVTVKGVTRWLHVGVDIQPSEVLKIAMPLMLAWWFQRREGET